MTDILPWLLANWLAIAAGLVLLVLLIVGISSAVCWYFKRWVIEAEREPEPLPDYAFGDVVQVPRDYWQRVAAKEGKRGAA